MCCVCGALTVPPVKCNFTWRTRKRKSICRRHLIAQKKPIVRLRHAHRTQRSSEIDSNKYSRLVPPNEQKKKKSEALAGKSTSSAERQSQSLVCGSMAMRLICSANTNSHCEIQWWWRWRIRCAKTLCICVVQNARRIQRLQSVFVPFFFFFVLFYRTERELDSIWV